MSEVRKHIHKLKRHHYSTGVKVYFCVDDCSFKITTELALGKNTICWRCGKVFRLNQYAITLAKPHCDDCHVFKNNKHHSKPKRRKNDVVVIEDSPASIMMNIQAKAEINDLRSRLNSLLSQQSVAASSNDNLTTKPTIVEYQPEEDDDLI